MGSAASTKLNEGLDAAKGKMAGKEGEATAEEKKQYCTDLRNLAALAIGRYNTLRESPADAKHKLCVVQFKVPGAKNGGSDKGPDGNRIDSIPIANGVIEAGGSCELILYDAEQHDKFVEDTAKYDALIVRINPGQLSQGTPDGTQGKFDALMNDYITKGKLVWSSPKIQTQMGAKDALVNIKSLNCGLTDTFAYYDEPELIEGFKKTCAFQPRVIKQNRGSAGEGIWLCWLWDKAADKKVDIYPAKTLGEVSLADDDYLKLMEMNDNHVEYHTVKEFMTFCVGGPSGEGAGAWTSTFPGEYLKGGKEAGGQLVDQRLLPRIDEGEVRILMAGDTCQMAIHKKPMGGGLSAVGGNSEYTYYKPTDAKYKGLVEKLYADIPLLLPSLGLEGEALPLLWTCDYIPKNPDDWAAGPYDRSCTDAQTEYTVGEFNCSCVGISKFQAVCGGEKTLADVSDEDYYDACELTDLMGVKAIEMLKKAKGGGGATASSASAAAASPSVSPPPADLASSATSAPPLEPTPSAPAPVAPATPAPPDPAKYKGPEALVVDVDFPSPVDAASQWHVTGNFKDFFEILGFPGAPNSSTGDGKALGSTRKTEGFGDPMIDTLRHYSDDQMSMTYQMTSIPAAIPMDQCVISWAVVPGDEDNPNGCQVYAHAEIIFNGKVGKGFGMPDLEAGEEPYSTYDGMAWFWGEVFSNWMNASFELAQTYAEEHAAEMAAMAKAAENEDIPLLPPEPEVPEGAPPEDCGGTTMSAFLAAAVKQAGGYLKGVDQAAEDRFNAKMNLKETKLNRESAEEKVASSWKVLCKEQEKEREATEAYNKAINDVPEAKQAYEEATEAKAAAEAAFAAAEDAEKKEKVKAKKAEKKKEADEAKKKVAEATKEEKLAEKAIEEAEKDEEVKNDALIAQQGVTEKAMEKWKNDSDFAKKKKDLHIAAEELIAKLGKEDEEKALYAKKLKAAIERDALTED